MIKRTAEQKGKRALAWFLKDPPPWFVTSARDLLLVYAPEEHVLALARAAGNRVGLDRDVAVEQINEWICECERTGWPERKPRFERVKLGEEMKKMREEDGR